MVVDTLSDNIHLIIFCHFNRCQWDLSIIDLCLLDMLENA